MEKSIIAQKSPIPVEPKKGETAYLCACKHTKNSPYCDGIHDNLKEE